MKLGKLFNLKETRKSLGTIKKNMTNLYGVKSPKRRGGRRRVR